MRTLVLALALLVALVVAAGFVAEQLVADEDLQDELIRRVEASTGGRLEIAGGVGLSLFPGPRLTLDAARYQVPLDGLGTFELIADRVDLTVGPIALLQGEVAVEELILIRPTILVRLDEASRTQTEGVDPPLADLLIEGALVRRLRVVDGALTIVEAGNDAGRTFRAIDLAARLEEARGPLSAEGAFRLASERLAFEAQVGRLNRDGTTTLQLAVESEGEGAGRFEIGFSGLLATGASARWQGRLRATFEHPGRVLGILTEADLGLPSWLDRSLEVEGRIASEGDQLEATELVLSSGETTGDGRLSARFGADPELDLTLAFEQVQAGESVRDALVALMVVGQLPTALRGAIDLSADRIGLGNGTLSRARLTLALGGGGDVAVEQARATLPGGADFRFQGRAQRGGETLVGEVALVSEQLRPLLAWLELEPDGLPDDSLRRLGVQADLRLTPRSLRLDRIESRLDASTITGSAEWRLGGRGRMMLALAIDRLNLDPYLPTDDAKAGWHALDRLGSRDLALAVRIDTLTQRGLRWTDAALEGRSGGRVLQIDRLEAEGIGETEVRASGRIDFGAKVAEGAGSLVAERPALLLRRFGIEPPPSLTRLAPLRLDVTAGQRGQEIALGLDGRLQDIEVNIEGTARWPAPEAEDGGGVYAFDLSVVHPHYHRLIDALALGFEEPDESPSGLPLAFRGKLQGQIDRRVGVTGSLGLGVTRVTGEVSLEQGVPRPQLRMNLSLADPRRETLVPWLGLFGLPFDPTLFARPIVGNWPRQRLALGSLPAFDLTLDLNAKGGLAGDGLDVMAEVAGARLTVPRFSARPFGGRATGEALVELDRRPPFGALALTLEDLDAAALLAWLGVPAGIEGRLDGYTEATAMGLSAHEVVRSLSADVELTLRDGAFADLPAPLATHAGEPALPRGEPARASIPRLELELDVARGIGEVVATATAAPAPAEVEGHVDLLLWATDLKVRLPPWDDPTTLRVVGPLDRPQVVVVGPVDQSSPPAPTGIAPPE